MLSYRIDLDLLPTVVADAVYKLKVLLAANTDYEGIQLTIDVRGPAETTLDVMVET